MMGLLRCTKLYLQVMVLVKKMASIVVRLLVPQSNHPLFRRYTMQLYKNRGVFINQMSIGKKFMEILVKLSICINHQVSAILNILIMFACLEIHSTDLNKHHMLSISGLLTLLQPWVSLTESPIIHYSFIVKVMIKFLFFSIWLPSFWPTPQISFVNPS